MDINQVYKAPSIPKLGKKTVSSSVLRGAAATTAAAPKLKVTNFSFTKPIASAQSLTIDVSAIKISESIGETNRILVEIQRQLAYDFANRIAEEKEAIKKIKAAESKRKFASKEASVEETKKITSSLGGAIGKVTAPIKSVFDKIKEFFGLILTGIVLNAAFKWLQDDNNRKLLDTIFEWIGKSFVPILIGIVSYKLIKWGYRIFKVGRWFWGLPCTLAKILGIKGQAKPTAPTVDPRTRPKIKPQALRDLGKAAAPRPGAGTILSSVGKPLMGSGIDAYRGGTPGRAPSIPKQVKPKPKGVGGGIIGNVAFVLAQLFAPQIQEAVGGLYNQMGIGMGNLSDEELKKQYEETYKSFVKYNSGQSSLPYGGNQSSFEEYEFGRLNLLQNEFKRRGLSFNNGGTVPGRGPGWIDSVRAMLAPGEEVIRTTSAMLFRPLLKDLNDNAGKLWLEFAQAVRKLFDVSERQKYTSEEFSKVIEDFDTYLKDDILKKKTGGTGGAGQGGMRTKQISATPKVTNVIVNSSPGSGGMTFFPMVLPTQKSKPPQIPQMQSKATDVPVISPVDFTNPWMDISPELYGIQLYG